MIPIPQPITNVSVYPYTTAPIELMPVIENASGTYSVGTLTTHVYYNMDLHGGERHGKLEKGGAYFAVATDKSGKSFRTHWMHCTDDGETPSFALTNNMAMQNATAPALPLTEGNYIHIEELCDFTTIINFTPPAIGSAEVTLGDNGWLIGTRTGTPHVNGFLIKNPELPKFFAVGSKNISISAKSVKTGQIVTYSNLTLVSADADECVFLQQFI